MATIPETWCEYEAASVGMSPVQRVAIKSAFYGGALAVVTRLKEIVAIQDPTEAASALASLYASVTGGAMGIRGEQFAAKDEERKRQSPPNTFPADAPAAVVRSVTALRDAIEQSGGQLQFVVERRS